MPTKRHPANRHPGRVIQTTTPATHAHTRSRHTISPDINPDFLPSSMSTSRHACSLCAVCLMHAYTAGLNNTQQGKHTIHTTQCGPVSPVNTHTFVLQCLRGAASHAKARAHWHKPQRERAQRQHACQIVSGTAAASHARIRLHTTPLHQRLWQTKWCRSLHTNACFASAALQLHPCVP